MRTGPLVNASSAHATPIAVTISNAFNDEPAPPRRLAMTIAEAMSAAAPWMR